MVGHPVAAACYDCPSLAPRRSPGLALTLYLGIGFRLPVMKIGEVATQAGVNVQTLRYYERSGLLREPTRRGSGYRDYSAEAVRIVRFIKHAQRLGFSLTDIADLLRLSSDQKDPCGDVRVLAHQKLAEIESKIASLRAMRRALKALAQGCEQPRSDSGCPLLRALAEDK